MLMCSKVKPVTCVSGRPSACATHTEHTLMSCVCVCVCVCLCVRACVRACVSVCACVRVIQSRREEDRGSGEFLAQSDCSDEWLSPVTPNTHICACTHTHTGRSWSVQVCTGGCRAADNISLVSVCVHFDSLFASHIPPLLYSSLLYLFVSLMCSHTAFTAQPDL